MGVCHNSSNLLVSLTSFLQWRPVMVGPGVFLLRKDSWGKAVSAAYFTFSFSSFQKLKESKGAKIVLKNVSTFKRNKFYSTLFLVPLPPEEMIVPQSLVFTLDVDSGPAPS